MQKVYRQYIQYTFAHQKVYKRQRGDAEEQ